MTDPILSIKTPNGRHYKHPISASVVPSITNVIGMKDKPALVGWAAREVATFAAENLDVLGKLERQERIDLAKGSPYRSSHNAADRGTEVHGWIETYIKKTMSGRKPGRPEGYEKSSITAKNMWTQFGAFVKKYDPEWVASEFTVWSDTYEYAGTGDFIAKIKGSYVWVDAKTGKGVYPEVGMQIAALRGADYMFLSDGERTVLPPFDRGAVLHVRPRGTRFHPLDHMDECFEAFLGLRQVFRWHVEYAGEVIIEVPKVEA